MATPYTTLIRLGLYVSNNQSRIDDTSKDSSSKEKDDSTSKKNDVITQEKGPTKSPKEINFLCHDCILNVLFDQLYDIYCPTSSSSKFWNALESTYGEEDIGLEKCTVDSFNNYK